MNTPKLEEILARSGVMIIDGAMSTALEELGAELSDRLWTAKVLAQEPALVEQVHLDYLRAGADCGITCSYQASIPGFEERGFSEKEAEDLIARSVSLFHSARSRWWEEEGRASGRPFPLCLASIGPYGAYLADGSEYRGDYDVSEDALTAFHRRRMEILHEAGADMLLIETQPSLREALLEARIAESLGADYWVSFSCRDARRINDGTPVRDCVEAFAGGFPRLKMIGVNCTAPQFVSPLIRELRASSGLPIAVYPNSGRVYDPKTKTWSRPRDMKPLAAWAMEYMAEGACAVGGCCTTDAEDIRAVREARGAWLGMGRPALARIPQKGGSPAGKER